MRFEPRAIIVNRGNTPAYKVKFSVCADVVPFPLADDYPFELPEIPTGEAGSIIASTLNKIVSAVVPKTYSDSEAARIKAGIEARLVMWGHVTYEDAFGIARFVKFGFSYLYFEDGINNMSDDIPRHNESN